MFVNPSNCNAKDQYNGVLCELHKNEIFASRKLNIYTD